MPEKSEEKYLYQPAFTSDQLALVSLAMSIMYADVLKSMGLRTQEQADGLAKAAQRVIHDPEMRESIKNLNGQMMRLLGRAVVQGTIGVFEDSVEGIGILFISIEEEKEEGESPPDLGPNG